MSGNDFDIVHVTDLSEPNLTTRLASLIPSGRTVTDPATYFANNAQRTVLDYHAGGTDHATALRAAIAAGRPARFTPRDYALGSRIDIAGSVALIADVSGTLIAKTATSTSDALRIKPAADFTGTATAHAVTSEIKVTGAGWVTNAHAGKWVTLGTTFAQTRRVLGNTSDTLTLQYDLDTVAAGGETVSIYTPIPYVEIRGLDIDGSAANGGAGIVIQYASVVKIDSVRSRGHVGNACSIYHADRVRIADSRFESSNFGLFVYNSDDVAVVNCKGADGFGAYAVQLKDCRNAIVLGGSASGGEVGVDVKCSGLNPSFNCLIANFVADGCNVGVKAHALHDEGTTYHAENFAVEGILARNCDGAGIQMQQETTAELRGGRVSGGSIRGCLTGIAAGADDVVVDGASIARSSARAIDITRSRVQVRNCTLRDNNYNAVAVDDAEIRIYSTATDATVRGNLFVKTDAASKSTRAVREMASTNDNDRLGPNRIIDTTGTYTLDYQTLGAGTKTLAYPDDYQASGADFSPVADVLAVAP